MTQTILAAEEAARKKQNAVLALTKRKAAEQAAASALNKSPPQQLLDAKRLRREQSASSSSSRILKQHPATPARHTAAHTVKTPVQSRKVAPRSVTPETASVPATGQSVTYTEPNVQNSCESEDSSVDNDPCALEEAFDTIDRDDLEDDHQDHMTMADPKGSHISLAEWHKLPADITNYELEKLKEKLQETAEENGFLSQQLASQGKELNTISGKYDELLKSCPQNGNKPPSNKDNTVSAHDHRIATQDLGKARKELDKSKKLYDSLKAKYEKSQKALKALQAQVRDLKKQSDPKAHGDLMKQVSELTTENGELHASNEKLAAVLEEAMKELKTKGKALDCEVAEDVLTAAKTAVKDVVYRKVKLVTSKKLDEVKTFTKMVYDVIKGERGFEEKDTEDELSVEEFHRIYQKPLMAYFNNIRSNTQQYCLDTVVGKYSEAKLE